MTVKKRSWWETPQTPAWSFSLSALWAVVASLQWINLATGDDTGARNVITGVVATLVAILCLGQAIVRLRRKRRDPA